MFESEREIERVCVVCVWCVCGVCVVCVCVRVFQRKIECVQESEKVRGCVFEREIGSEIVSVCVYVCLCVSLCVSVCVCVSRKDES